MTNYEDRNKSYIVDLMMRAEGKTIEEVSEKTGISCGYIIKMMANNKFTFDQMIVIANALGYKCKFYNKFDGVSFEIDVPENAVKENVKIVNKSCQYPSNVSEYMFGSDDVSNDYILFSIENDLTEKVHEDIMNVFCLNLTVSEAAEARGVSESTIYMSLIKARRIMTEAKELRDRFGFCLSINVLNKLIDNCITNIDELLGKSKEDLLRLFTEDSIESIEEALRKKDLHLKSSKTFEQAFLETIFTSSEMEFIDEDKVIVLYEAILTEDEKASLHERFDKEGSFNDLLSIDPIMRVRSAYLKLYPLHEEFNPVINKEPRTKYVKDLGLSIKTKNALIRNGVESVEELTSMTPVDLQKLQRIGYGAVAEITASLGNIGLSLR